MEYLYEVKQKGLDSVVWSWRGDESAYDLETVKGWINRGYVVKRYVF